MNICKSVSGIEWDRVIPMTSQGLEPWCTPMHTSRCHEQTKRVAPLLACLPLLTAGTHAVGRHHPVDSGSGVLMQLSRFWEAELAVKLTRLSSPLTGRVEYA